MSAATTALLVVAIPALTALAVLALGRRPDLREAASLVGGAVTLLLAASLVGPVTGGARPRLELVEMLPGVPLALGVGPLGLLFALVASTLWIVTTVYAIGYMRGHHETNQTRFYAFFALSIAAALGVAFAGNLFTLFAFYEVLTLCTFPLVTHHQTEEARRAGRIYLGILLGTSIGFQLLALIWTWSLAGTTELRPGGILQGTASPAVLSVILALFVFGVGKAAVMPFHRWLPAAMVAPTPVSALLHAVAVVKAGVFTILTVVVYVFGLDLVRSLAASRWLAWAAGATIILASLVAMRKQSLKARLAYSTVSQLSYIVLGALLANQAGVVGGGMHIAMHAFGKITLFFAAGAVLVAAHETEIPRLGGLGRRMPITFGAFFVAALSIIGVPPAGGTWSKWMLGMATLDAGQLGLLAVLMLSSLLSLVYLLEIPIRGFFGSPPVEGGRWCGRGGARAFLGRRPARGALALRSSRSWPRP
ncbi:MAG: proton-conducting transporter membrane subunit [Gemmatimonadales bacterium]